MIIGAVTGVIIGGCHMGAVTGVIICVASILGSVNWPNKSNGGGGGGGGGGEVRGEGQKHSLPPLYLKSQIYIYKTHSS